MAKRKSNRGIGCFIVLAILFFVGKALLREAIVAYDSQNQSYHTTEDTDDDNDNLTSLDQADEDILKLASASDKVDYDSISPCHTATEVIKHAHQWENLQSHGFESRSKIHTAQACIAEYKREHFSQSSYTEHYWGKVYQFLVEIDQTKMPEVYEMFDQIGKDNNLNYNDFAEMVVTFVQEIPYVLIHPNSCEKDAEVGGFSKTYHEEGRPCLSNKKYGIQSPSEFMFNLKGDCDTRAVFAYLVLRHFGYDAVVFCSERHAMLGINVAGHGNYLPYDGKKYYFWETTGKGWVIGTIPPEYQSDNWEIALAN
jgi:hypothetical protein